MTATADFMPQGVQAQTISAMTTDTVEPARIADGGRMIVRGAQRLIGVSLLIAALGVWIAPGATWDADIMLFKLILSVVGVIAGMGLISASGTPRAPEVHIDTIRREVRLVRRLRGSEPLVLQSCAFADLAHAEQDGSNVSLWDKGGIFLAEVSLTDRTALSSLVAGLQDEGKLA